MAEIGSLVINLLAETASFNSNISRAAANLNSNATRMNRSVAAVQRQLGSLATLAKGAAGALAGYLSLDVARNALDYAGGLGEVAQQLGVTTRGLQIYRFAASQVGVSQEQIDNGLQRLTRSLGQVAAGAKGPMNALKALGFTTGEIDRLARMTADEALPLISDRLARVEVASQRAAVEVALFGKSGQQLDPLLKGGSKAVNEFAAAAEKLGLVLSSAEIQQADDAADKLSAVKTVLEANIARTVAQNADSILKLANSFVALATGTAKFMAQNPEAIKAGLGALAGAKVGGLPLAVVGGAAGATGGFDNFGAQVTGSKIIYEREGVLGVLTASRQELVAAVTEDQRRMQAEFNRLNNLRLSLPEGSPVRKSVAGAQAAVGRKLGFGAGTATGAAAADAPAIEIPEFLSNTGGAGAVDAYGQSLGRLNEQLSLTAIELQAVNENWPDSQLDAARLRQQLYNDIAAVAPDITAKQRAELTGLADALVEQERALTLARMAQDIGTNSAERYAEAITSLTDDVKALADSLTEIPDLTVKLPDGIFDELDADRDFAASIGESFGYAAEDALMHMDSIRGAAQALVSDLARIFIRRNITLPLADMVTGWSNSLMGNNAPVAGGFDAGAALAAGDSVLQSLGASGSSILANDNAAPVTELASAATKASQAIYTDMVPAIGQAATSLLSLMSGSVSGGGGFLSTVLSLGSSFAGAAGGGGFDFGAAMAGADAALASIPRGFSSGGWTGGAARDQVAGVVHGQEYVLNADAVRKIGLPALDSLNRGGRLPGFRDGGFVGVRAAMREVQPANDGFAGMGDVHVHLSGSATREDGRRVASAVQSAQMRQMAQARQRGLAG